MRRIPVLFFFLFFSIYGSTQILPPDKIYGELFADVQTAGIFADSKTFTDCIPKRDPDSIVKDYLAVKNNPNLRFSLKLFVEHNFFIPDESSNSYTTRHKDVVAHIEELWKVLRREKDTLVKGSSLLPLPYSYIVPGGRFREVYYWDSYFTMLGLKESGEHDMITNMVNNFAFLIDRVGHIPNGNRSYYLSRSQPPFFSLMIDLLAEIKGPQTYVIYQPALLKEYDYWMDRTAKTKHVVKMPDGSILNRYYDQLNIPRQESWKEDVETVKKFHPDTKSVLYRNLRSAAESGWDFSSRWLKDGKTLSTIQTTAYVPVDLNSLLYHLEQTLARSYNESGNKLQAARYKELATRRKKAINKYCWSSQLKFFTDYLTYTKKPSASLTLAGMFPFFLNISDSNKMNVHVIKTLKEVFIKAGGVVTTNRNTGQQWDAPNGWAPLQWVTIIGLENYGKHEQAALIAKRWVALNKKVFASTGRLMEKYNVVNTSLEAGGGEYPSQDGFGWTNGVLLALIKKYNLN
ncbi:MAG: alpha,alpha-trehalase TreA [Flavisolibacter sp.]